MINYNRLGYEIKRDLSNFSEKISRGLKIPKSKFVTQMLYGILAGNKVHLSEIALGSWMTDLKGSSQEDTARETVKLGYENGINFFDCADAYSSGAAERFLGKVLKDYPRRELVISSKVYFPTGSGVNDRGLSRKHIMENCDQSLKNMQLDYLDLYYCHRYDENTDLEETLRAMSDLVAQGKVLYYGVSEEWGSARIEEAQKIIDKLGLYPISVIQPQYNMMDRYIEHEIMDTCRKYGIGITSFSPLAQGLLTGKYKKGQPYPEGSRATHQADRQINDLPEKQEKTLRFQHFSNKDALKLGIFITNKIYEENMALAVAIRRMNGTIIYQHLADGTNYINQNWMERKFNTVSYFERSSLGAWALEALSGETVDVHGLSKEDFIFVGGGFPFRLKTGEIVAVLTVSNLPHMDDHKFIIRVLSEYLGEKM